MASTAVPGLVLPHLGRVPLIRAIHGLASALFAAFVFFACFAFSETSPYDVIAIPTILLWACLGIRLHRGAVPLVLLLLLYLGAIIVALMPVPRRGVPGHLDDPARLPVDHGHLLRDVLRRRHPRADGAGAQGLHRELRVLGGARHRRLPAVARDRGPVLQVRPGLGHVPGPERVRLVPDARRALPDARPAHGDDPPPGPVARGAC